MINFHIKYLTLLGLVCGLQELFQGRTGGGTSPVPVCGGGSGCLGGQITLGGLGPLSEPSALSRNLPTHNKCDTITGANMGCEHSNLYYSGSADKKMIALSRNLPAHTMCDTIIGPNKG